MPYYPDYTREPDFDEDYVPYVPDSSEYIPDSPKPLSRSPVVMRPDSHESPKINMEIIDMPSNAKRCPKGYVSINVNGTKKCKKTK